MLSPVQIQREYPGAVDLVIFAEGERMDRVWNLVRDKGMTIEEVIQTTKEGILRGFELMRFHKVLDTSKITYQEALRQLNHPDFERYLRTKL